MRRLFSFLSVSNVLPLSAESAVGKGIAERLGPCSLTRRIILERNRLTCLRCSPHFLLGFRSSRFRKNVPDHSSDELFARSSGLVEQSFSGAVHVLKTPFRVLNHERIGDAFQNATRKSRRSFCLSCAFGELFARGLQLFLHR